MLALNEPKENPPTMLDPLTDWAKSAKGILASLNSENAGEGTPIQAQMLALMQALDRNQIDLQLKDEVFIGRTEVLLLALLRGDSIEISDLEIYAARKEIFAAAQVIYNQAVARGYWPLHPEFTAAMRGDT